MADNQVIVELLLANNQYLSQLAESKRKTEEFAKKSQSGIGGMMSSFGGLGKFIGGAAVLGALNKIKDETIEYEKAQAKLNTTIISTGGAAGVSVKAANDLAEQLSNLTSVDDDVIVGAEAVLLRFRNMSSKVFPEATKATLDLSAATGKDLNSAALMVGKALDNPVKGMTALNKIGVALTITQQEQIKQMIAMGNQAGAQKVVLKQLADAFGGQAAAQANTLSGALDGLQNKLGNFFAWLGTKVLTGPLVWLNEKLGDLQKEIAKTREEAQKELLEEKFGKKDTDPLAIIKKAGIDQSRKKPSFVDDKSGYDSDKKGEDGLDAKTRKMRQGVVQMFTQTYEGLTKISDLSNDFLNQVADNAISVLETKKSQIGALFDFMEQRAMQSAGLQEETASQHAEKEISQLQKQITKTTNLAQKKAMREKMVELQKEKTKADIEEKGAKRKQALDLYMDILEMQMKRKQFERNKAYQLSMVWINTAAAITAAWLTAWSMGFPPLAIAMGAVSTALLLANAAVQTATISQQKAPAYESGSWDVQTTGPAILHGGEIVTPKPIADSIRSGDAYLGGGAGGDIVMVMDGRQVGRVVRERNSRFARNIGGRSFSMAGAY